MTDAVVAPGPAGPGAAAPDDEARFRGHSVTLNSAVWRLAVALGDVAADAEQIEVDVDDVIDRAVAAIADNVQLRAEARAQTRQLCAVINRADADPADPDAGSNPWDYR